VMDRFFRKVDKTGSCWNWLAGKDKDGYGKIKIARKDLRAHRVSWEIHNGIIPGGLLVLHRCDNPSCVNPSHLFLGTALDNNRDRDAKGRNGWSKITHCPHGHEYTPENTSWWKRERSCKNCMRIAYHKRRAA